MMVSPVLDLSLAAPAALGWAYALPSGVWWRDAKSPGQQVLSGRPLGWRHRLAGVAAVASDVDGTRLTELVRTTIGTALPRHPSWITDAGRLRAEI